MDESISLNKFISDTGYCSRREADNLITSGRVLLNDLVATLGNRYTPGDTVEVDGSIITAAKKEKRVYLALNKPAGITTTSESHIKDNIISFVGYPKRIFPIGRLDKDSEGLIFLTNDGDIINKILRAGNNHEKEYVVRVNKPITPAFIQQMSQGVPILDTRTLPCKVQMMGRQTFRITLTQGLNRQIRRMCEHLDYAVVGLQRVRIMNIKLDKLAVGKWRYLSEPEVAMLMEMVEDSSKINTETKSAARKRKASGEAAYAPQRHTGHTPGEPPAKHVKEGDKKPWGNKTRPSEKSAKGEKFTRGDKTRSDKPYKNDRSPKSSRAPKSDKPNQGDKTRSDKPYKNDRSPKSSRAPKSDKPNQGDKTRSDKPYKSDRGPQSSRAPKSDKPHKGDITRGDKPYKSGKAPQSSRAPKSDKPHHGDKKPWEKKAGHDSKHKHDKNAKQDKRTGEKGKSTPPAKAGSFKSYRNKGRY